MFFSKKNKLVFRKVIFLSLVVAIAQEFGAWVKVVGGYIYHFNFCKRYVLKMKVLSNVKNIWVVNCKQNLKSCI